MQKTLLHPFGLALIIVSLVLAGLMLFVLDRWSGQALWIVLLGLLAYAASVAVLQQRRTMCGTSIENEDYDPHAQEDEAQVGNLPDFRKAVEDALQHLNNLATLAQCQLLTLIPRTLGELTPLQRVLRWLRHFLIWLPSIPNELTPLEKAQALRLVLVDAIEQLKPGGGPTGARSPETLQHDILNEAYVEERSVANIITRHNISDTTYFRNRRAAVSAMAHHLESQEEQNGR